MSILDPKKPAAGASPPAVRPRVINQMSAEDKPERCGKKAAKSAEPVPEPDKKKRKHPVKKSTLEAAILIHKLLRAAMTPLRFEAIIDNTTEQLPVGQWKAGMKYLVTSNLVKPKGRGPATLYALTKQGEDTAEIEPPVRTDNPMDGSLSNPVQPPPRGPRASDQNDTGHVPLTLPTVLAAVAGAPLDQLFAQTDPNQPKPAHQEPRFGYFSDGVLVLDCENCKGTLSRPDLEALRKFVNRFESP